MIDQPRSVVLLAVVGEYLTKLSRSPDGQPLEAATRYELRVAANLVHQMWREAAAGDELDDELSTDMAAALGALTEAPDQTPVDDAGSPTATVQDLAEQLDHRLTMLTAGSTDMPVRENASLTATQREALHRHLRAAVCRRLDIQRPQYRRTTSEAESR